MVSRMAAMRKFDPSVWLEEMGTISFLFRDFLTLRFENINFLCNLERM